MKIYIASSWKNARDCISLAEWLEEYGHEVDCFCRKSADRYVFHFSEIAQLEELDAITFMDDERSQRAFVEDKRWLDWCEVVVMLLPCGNSAHLEAGYAKGQGKTVYIIGDLPKGEFDVMYGFADKLIRLEDSLQLPGILSSQEACS